MKTDLGDCQHRECVPPQAAVLRLPACSPHAIAACERHAKDLRETFPNGFEGKTCVACHEEATGLVTIRTPQHTCERRPILVQD